MSERPSNVSRPRAALALALASAGCFPEIPDVRDAAAPAAPMIDVAAPDGTPYRIDRTEVTNADYAAFLESGGADPSGVGPACAADHDAIPRDAWPAPSELADHPVVFVDWCDASAYCAWAGKRLCARIDGDAYDADDGNDAQISEWFNACSAGGAGAYPYGDYQAGVCNDAGGGDGTTPVLEPPTCEGGFPGLFGMSGNAREWDGCVDDSGPSSACLVRGGGFKSNPTEDGGDLGCMATFTQSRDVGHEATGFRCCGS